MARQIQTAIKKIADVTTDNMNAQLRARHKFLNQEVIRILEENKPDLMPPFMDIKFIKEGWVGRTSDGGIMIAKPITFTITTVSYYGDEFDDSGNPKKTQVTIPKDRQVTMDAYVGFRLIYDSKDKKYVAVDAYLFRRDWSTIIGFHNSGSGRFCLGSGYSVLRNVTKAVNEKNYQMLNQAADEIRQLMRTVNTNSLDSTGSIEMTKIWDYIEEAGLGD